VLPPRACSARSTTRSTFYLVLPVATLTVDPSQAALPFQDDARFPAVSSLRIWRQAGVLAGAAHCGPVLVRPWVAAAGAKAAIAGVGSAGRLPVSTSRVHRRIVRTVAVRRLWGPGAEPSRCPRNRTPRPCPRWTAAVRAAPGGIRSRTADTAAALSSTGDTAAAGHRPSGHIRRPQPQWAPATCRHCQGIRWLPELRPPGDAVQTARW
jgi:hypothetical protein